MAYEVTATRRRPQQFESLAGQEFVVSTLKNAIEQGRIAHAYLFSGPRGVGKTTSARLLAKALNCVHGPTATPCGECDNCKGIAKGSSLDVIEIDGASNTGVNDVRAIKEEVLFPPTSSRYKIYIIDEVHMLSQSAFNALLKTIEEPPEYVVFIFATTETQKVPATIRSRCQQFNFQLIPLETIEKLLGDAAQEMGIKADKDALFWIAKEATGSMRDAYTLFDQVVSFSNGEITLDKIREKLGVVGMERIGQIMADILSRRQSAAMDKVNDLLAKGVSTEQVIKDFTDYFRTLLLIKEGVKSENVLGERMESFPPEIRTAFNEEQLEAGLDLFLNLYRDIRYSLNPRFELELAVSKLSRLRYVASNASVLEQLARLKNDLVTGTITPLNPALADQKSIEPQVATPLQTTTPKTDVPETAPSKKSSSPAPTTTPESSNAQPVVQEPQPVVAPAVETPHEEEKVHGAQPTLEGLKGVLPQGVVDVKNEDDGLVLCFANKLFYQLALRSLQKVKDDVSAKLGAQVNVVLALSERNETQPQPEPAVQAPLNEAVPPETPAKAQPVQTPPKPEPQAAVPIQGAAPTQSTAPTQVKTMNALEEERKNLINDLILAFDGREEKI